MLIATRRTRDSLIVRMTGELDLQTADLFRAEIRKEWDASEQVRHLILDLRGLTFIDSSGVGAILGRCRDVRRRGPAWWSPSAPDRTCGAC